MDNKAFDYFDSTHSINGGIVVDGKLWNRPLDEFGIAFGFDSLQGAKAIKVGISNPIGTGTLNFSPEKTFETYYRIGLNNHLELTLDYQTLINPNYIKQSTPAHVFGLRLRANF
jgi:high affinity Mn2+ porin